MLPKSGVEIPLVYRGIIVSGRRYSSLSKAENDLLSEEQKRELVAHDNEAKNSNNRWNKRVARRLHDGEEVVDCVDFMNLPVGVRLAWLYDEDSYDAMLSKSQWRDFGADDYGEEATP